MSEYITGRVKLSDCESSKAIQGMKKGDQNKELAFVQEDNGDIIVDQVPPVSCSGQCTELRFAALQPGYGGRNARDEHFLNSLFLSCRRCTE